MASTGNVFPGTGENNAGIGATAWTNPGNIVSDNTTDATCAAAASSQYLVARNFGFSIPAGSTIQGITVRVEASEHSAGTESLNGRLQDDSGTLVGSSKAQTVSGTAKAVYTYGGTADLWGAALTPTIVNDPDFGVRLWFTTAHDVRIDFVTLAVEYNPNQTATLTEATATASAQAVTAVPGGITVPVTEAVATAAAQPVVAVPGGITVPVTEAIASGAAQDVSVSQSDPATVLEAAVAAAMAHALIVNSQALSAVLLGASESGASLAASSTIYGTLGMGGFIGFAGSAPESSKQITVRVAGWLRQLWVNVTSNDRGASTYQTRVNTADGNQSISIGASQTGLFTETVGAEDALTAGDVFATKLVTGSGGSSFVIRGHGAEFVSATTTATTQLMYSGELGTYVTQQTRYTLPMARPTANLSANTNARLRVYSAGTLANFAVNIETNSWSVANTATVQQNGSNSALTVSIGASQTGTFEDTTHSVSMAANDDFNFEWAMGAGSGSISTPRYKVEWTTTDGSYIVGTGFDGGGATSATLYRAPFAGGTFDTTTESVVQQRVLHSVIFHDLQALIDSNAATGASTATLRKNGSNTALTLSVGAGQTGRFEDLTASHCVPCVQGDLVSYQTVQDGSGALVWNSLAMRAMLPWDQSVTPTFAVATGVSQAVTVTLGGLSVSLTEAIAAAVAQAVTASQVLTVPVSEAVASAAAQDVDVSQGGGSTTLIEAIATASAQPVTVTLGGITVTITEATATASAQPVTVTLGGITAALQEAVASAQAQGVAVTLGGIVATLTEAIAAASAQDVTATAALVAVLTEAIAVATGQPVTVVLGGIAVQITEAVATASAQDVAVTIGLTALLTEAIASAAGQAVTVSLGGLTITIAEAVAAAVAQDVSTTFGGITVPIGVAIATATGLPVAISFGGIIVPIGTATAGASAQDVTVVLGSIAALKWALRAMLRIRAAFDGTATLGLALEGDASIAPAIPGAADLTPDPDWRAR